MVVTITHAGYIKRIPVATYRSPAPRRQGGPGALPQGQRLRRGPLCGEHSRLRALLYQPRQGLPPQGPRAAHRQPPRARLGHRERAQPRRGRAAQGRDHLPRVPRGRVPDVCHRLRHGQEDRHERVRQEPSRRHHRHQPARRRRAGQRAPRAPRRQGDSGLHGRQGHPL